MLVEYPVSLRKSTLAWLPLGLAKFTRLVTLKTSPNSSSSATLEIDAVAESQIRLEEAGTAGAVALVLVSSTLISIRTRPRVRTGRQRLCLGAVAIGVELAVGQLKGGPLRALATQLTESPPVFGTMAVPLTTRLCGMSDRCGLR